MDRFPTKETMTIEFKSDRKCLADSTLIDAVVGLTNADGGTLYLGIEDNGTVTGLHSNHSHPIRIATLIADKTMPPVSVRADIQQDSKGLSVLVIEIPKSRTIVATRTGKILRRRLNIKGAPENLPLYPYELTSHLSELGIYDMSAQPLLKATMDDFDVKEVARLRQIIMRQRGETTLLQLTDEDLYKALHLVTTVDDTPVPTLAGILLLGKEERMAELVPAAEASFQVMEGNTIRVNEQVRWPLLATFESFAEFLKPWNPEREITDGLYRTSIPEFDLLAFREALVNAFCHRDYYMLGMTRVLINEAGLTISNPGGFIAGVTLQNLLSAEPRGRNPILADALKRIGLAERTGRGIDQIFTGSIIYGRPIPDYSESNNYTVTVFIPRAKPDIAFTKMIQEEQSRTGIPFSIQALMILSALRTYQKLTIQGIMDYTKLSEIRAHSEVNTLIERGFIERIGIGKNTSYILSAAVYATTNHTAAYVRQRDIDKVRYPEMILQYIRAKGSISRIATCELLHMSSLQAYRLLRKMVDDQKLIKVGKTKNTRYVLPK